MDERNFYLNGKNGTAFMQANAMMYTHRVCLNKYLVLLCSVYLPPPAKTIQKDFRFARL